jgi:uncharacterized membrane protein
MKTYLISFSAALITLLVIDGTWLNIMSGKFYKPLMSHFMAKNIKLTPVMIFYVMYAISITILLIIPAIKLDYSLCSVFFHGCLLGLTAYGAYDLVNHATVKDWPVKLTVVDMLWGTFLTGFVGSITFKTIKYFG